ncbi:MULTISPECIES: hypothetical protein [unclassified Mesorhizobium]|uniref:hypothetical protein n=1 Tax=unclassified Mesorhizobium TaxID=325217 RepID=UPI0015E4384F
MALATRSEPHGENLALGIVFALADRRRRPGVDLDERHRHVADDNLVLPKSSFEFRAAVVPVRQIDFFRHHLEDNDVVSFRFRALPPQALRRRLKKSRNAFKSARQFLLDPIEIFPRKRLAAVVGSGKQDLDKVHAATR